VEGLLAGGMDVIRVGILPTAGIALLTREWKGCLGAIISASHNPPQDNGIKFVGPHAMKIDDADERAIEERLNRDVPGENPTRGTERPPVENPAEAYGRWIVARIDRPEMLSGRKLCVDCGFGASVVSAPAILRSLGAQVEWLNCENDGSRINVECGATRPEAVSRLARVTGADAGLSFDGDQDRVILADEQGGIVDGDHMLAICGAALHDRGELSSATLVGTVMSNWGLEKFCSSRGIRLVRAAVGDRYVCEALLREGAILGGEPSGHVIFRNDLPTGDGMLTALRVLNVMIESGRPLSALASVVRKCPQVLRNVPVASKPPLETIPSIRVAIESARVRMGNEGRVLVRYSGTENLCRVMVEGADAALVDLVAEGLAAVVRKELA
jgi:phosphoglucosamine mutase